VRLPTALTIAVPVVLAAAFAPAPARAQASENTTIAESLFHDAQTRLAAGDVAAACDLFARSQRVEGALGTLLNLAACHEREGKTASAWTEFQNAIGWAVRIGDHAREQYARAHVASLDKELHRIVIEVTEAAPGMQVRLDDAPLPRDALGTAIPLDPGEHSIEVAASGKAPWVRKINLGPAAGTDRIEVKLEPLTSAAPEPPAAPPPPSTVDSTVPPAPSTAPIPPVEAGAWQTPSLTAPNEASVSAPHPANGKRIAGFVVGGVGVVGVGAAVALGIAMAEHASDRDALCPPASPCGNQRAFDDDHAARLDQQWMFVAGAVGIAALATGTYLILTSHDAPPSAARNLHVDATASSGGATLRLQGRW
jgi:hypothetical protein